MNTLAVATLAVPGTPELDVLLLAASLRRFGGTLRDASIWVLVPESIEGLSPVVAAQLAQLGVDVIPFAVDEAFLRFPLATKVAAAAAAEEHARGRWSRLAYCDRDTLFLREPVLLAGPGGGGTDVVLSYRPVHHRLIGSAWDAPVDPFWRMVYETFDVPQERLFMMRTHVGEAIRPYFNAGHFSVHPESGIMARWLDAFSRYYRAQEFVSFYDQDERYAVFAHQTILTGVVLSACTPTELHLLPESYNYPLHLHADVADARPATIIDVDGTHPENTVPGAWVSVRHEDLFDSDDWRSLRFDADIIDWLEGQPRVVGRVESR